MIYGRDAFWTAGLSRGGLTAHIARYFPAWRLAAHIPNPFPSRAGTGGDFFIYARQGAACAIPVMAFSWALSAAETGPLR